MQFSHSPYHQTPIMTGRYCLALLFVIILKFSGVYCHESSISFPDDLFPADISRREFRKQCPAHIDKIEFCVPHYEDCFGQLRSADDCKNLFCSCIPVYNEEDHAATSDKCAKYNANACVSVHAKGHSFQKLIFKKRELLMMDRIKKSMEQVNDAFSVMQKECGIEKQLEVKVNQITSQLNFTHVLLDIMMPYFSFQYMEMPLSRNNKCQKAMSDLRNSLERADSISATKLHIPYEFWYILADMGVFGKVISRLMAEEACGKASLDLNHNAAVQMNCYDQRNSKEHCDATFLEINEQILKTMDSKKFVCKKFVELTEIIHRLFGNSFYKAAADYHAEPTKVKLRGQFDKGFEGDDNWSITRRDTKHILIEMEASAKLPLKYVDYFNHVSSECWKSRRCSDVVALCGFEYEYCTHFVENNCQIQLSICLSNIETQDKKCQQSIEEISRILFSKTEGSNEKLKTVNMEDVSKERITESGNYFVIAIAILFIVLLLILGVPAWVFVCKHIGSKRSTTPSPEPRSPVSDEETSLVAFQYPLPVIRANNNNTNDREQLEGEHPTQLNSDLPLVSEIQNDETTSIHLIP